MLQWENFKHETMAVLTIEGTTDPAHRFVVVVHRLAGHFADAWFVDCEALGWRNERIKDAGTLDEAKRYGLGKVQSRIGQLRKLIEPVYLESTLDRIPSKGGPNRW